MEPYHSDNWQFLIIYPDSTTLAPTLSLLCTWTA